MKGILKLVDISSPVEGNIYINSGGFIVKQWWKSEEKSLKQIVIEYEERDAYEPLPDTLRLPLHPDDWKWAIEHMGEEVEFNIAHDLDNGWHGCIIIHPNPVIYTEEEFEAKVLSIMKNAFICGQNFELAALIRDHEKRIMKGNEYKEK